MIHLAVPGNARLTSSHSAISSPARRVATVVAASTLVALCAHASVPLPFTPVPVVLSDFAVILVGLLLGPAMGFAALALYLAEGAAGLPVFSPFGVGGVAQLLGPTAGYLLAYPLVAALAGALRVRLQGIAGNVLATSVAAAAASVFLLLSGATWLVSGVAWLHHQPSRSFAVALQLAIFPFLLGSVAKTVAAVAIVTSVDQLRKA